MRIDSGGVEPFDFLCACTGRSLMLMAGCETIESIPDRRPVRGWAKPAAGW